MDYRHIMPCNSSIFLVVVQSFVLLMGYLVNLLFFRSMFMGIFLFALYVIFFGCHIGRLFLVEEFKELLGIFSVLCFIIVGESLFLIMNIFVFSLVVIPYVLVPLFIIFWKVFRKKEDSLDRQASNIKCVTFKEGILLLSFLISLAISLYALVSSGTGAAVFSILQVVPSYFWLSAIALITFFIAECFMLNYTNLNKKWLMLFAFAVAFVFFGAYFLVFTHGWDADPYGWLTSIKLVFARGFKGEQWQIIPLERGTEAIVASVAKLSVTQFDMTASKRFFDLLSPLLAAIYLPLFTYLFMHKLDPGRHCSFYALGSLGFMLFLTFFDFAITNSNYLSSIFLFGTLFIVLKWLYEDKPRKSLTALLIISFLATTMLHPISGIYAIVAIALALSASGKIASSGLVIKIKLVSNFASKIRVSTLVYSITVLVVSIIPIVALLKGYDILNFFIATSHDPMAILKNSISFDDIARFFVPFWLQTPLTASHIVGDGYNWVRLPLFAFGLYRLSTLNITKKIKSWVLGTIISYFIAWFTIVTLLKALDHDPYRFALMLDLALLPIAGLLIGDLFNAVSSRISKNKIRKLSTVGFAILFAGLLIVPVTLTYELPLYPMRWSVEQPLPGRPTARAVTDAEINALEYIDNLHKNYAVVTSNSFTLEVATALLDFRSFNGTNNVFANSALISNIIINKNVQAIVTIAETTNSSDIILLFDTWYLRTQGITLNEVTNIESFFRFIGGSMRIFGDQQYSVYLLCIDLSNSHYGTQEVRDLSINKYNSTVYASSIAPSGIKGSALFFDGKKTYVAVNDSFPNQQNMTLEAWVYLSSNSAYSNLVISKWYGGAYPSRDEFMLAMFPTRNEIYFYLSDGVHISYVNTNSCPTFQWLHIAATYDGQHMRIYLNGSLASEKLLTTTIASSNTTLFVGSKNPEAEPQYFNGLIDEVRIYNRSLNSTEVSYSYENLAPKSTEGLTLWFSFDP